MGLFSVLMQGKNLFIRSYFKKLPLGLAVLLALFASSIFLFAYVAHEVLWEKEEQIDQHIFHFLSAQMINPRLTGLMKVITYFASAIFLQITYGLLILAYLIKKDLKRAVEIGVIGLGGFMVNYFMKLFFHRLRPANPLMGSLQNFSFPSGHATSGFIFYGLLIYLIWKTNFSQATKYVVSSILVLFALLIGFSRVYLRMHYASDVLGGFCIGFAWLLLTIWLMNRLKGESHKEVTKA